MISANERAFGRVMLMKRSKGYVMRSEKRPGYGSASGGGSKPKKSGAGISYIIITTLVSVLLWPIGMVLLWRRRVRMQAGTKLLISLLTLCVSVFLIVFALTVHVDNEKYTAFQDNANDWLNQTTTQLAAAGDATYQKGLETWGVMREFTGNAAEPAANALANTIDRGVALACQVRAKVQGVPVSDVLPENLAHLVPVPSPTATPEVNSREVLVHFPAEIPTSADAKPLTAGLLTPQGDVRPGETPAPTPSPTPTPEPTATPEPTEAPLEWSAVDENGEAEATSEPEMPLAAAEVAQVVETVTPTVTPEPTPEPTPVPTMSVQLKPAGQALVYYNPTGNYYHMQSTCTQMSGASVHTLSEAVAAGKKRCSECGTPDASILDAHYVVWLDKANVYHTTDACQKFDGLWTLTTLSDAIQNGASACEACEANLFAAMYASSPAITLAPTATPAPTDTPAPTNVEPVRVVPSTTLKPVGEATVYHSYDGKFYHRHETCKSMSASSPYKLADVVGDYKRCWDCDAPDGTMVGKECLWMDANKLCHTSDECASFAGDYYFILRDDALEQNLIGCPDCGADEYLVPNTVLGE